MTSYAFSQRSDPPRSAPLWASPVAVAWLVIAICSAAAYGSWTFAQRARATAQAATHNAQLARQAAIALRAGSPALLEGDAGPLVSNLLETILQESHTSDRALRSQLIRTLGPVGDTGVTGSRAHVELTHLTQAQAASIVQALEHTPLPLVIESADLTATSSGAWDLTLELAWLQKPHAAPGHP